LNVKYLIESCDPVCGVTLKIVISSWVMLFCVMQIAPILVPALLEDQARIQNMGRFYVYEMSRACGSLPGWELPEDGMYECRDLSSYFHEKNRFPFLVRIKNELAGFVLIDKFGSTPDIDWNIGEFFIIAKFQGQGMGKQVAFEVFKKFLGKWEVMQMPVNTPAIQFWKKIVATYTDGQYEESLKTIVEPEPHPMIVLRFDSR
jgi:predicted acetyltransferase